MGAGHDGAAAELARRLEADGFRVQQHDFLDLLPAQLGRLLSAGYHRLLDWAPAGYQRIYAATERTGRPRLAVRALLRSAERRTLAVLPPDTCAVVSTYPGASQVLGRLRRQGRLTVPAITYLTDFSVHTLWVAPGIDVHLAAHEIPAGQARAQGAAGVTATGPVAAVRFAPVAQAERRAARARFGLPDRAPLALLVAGSWGVGSIEETVTEIQDSGVAVPVVACGRNHALAERLRSRGIEHVYDWVEDMPALMSAADVLVQNAGGLTSLEAFASGLPVASYRCIPGHGQTNAAALQEAGLAAWIRTPAGLRPVLTDLLTGPLGRIQRARGLELLGQSSDPAQAIAAAATGTTASPKAPTIRKPTHTPAHRPALLATSSRTALPRRAADRPARRRARLGIPVMTAAVTATFTFGIGAPLAQAHAVSPGRLAELAHFLDAERW